MNLLSVIHYPVFGGPHNQALRLSASLTTYGWKTIVLLPDEPGNAAERLRTAEIVVTKTKLHRLRATVNPLTHALFGLSFWREVSAIRRLIRQHDIDLVQVHGLVNPHGAVAARLEGIPVVWQIVDTRPPMALRRLLMPLVARLADCVMFDGEALVSAYPGGAALSDKSFVYYPPVDVSKFHPGCAERDAVRLELGIHSHGPVVGTVANINPQKGYEYFLQAAAIIMRQIPDVTFLVVGSFYETHKAYADQIRALAAKLEHPDRIIFAGTRDDVERMFSAMDVSLITSVPRSEGTTTTAQESMALETPVIATDVGAVSEIVEDRVTGYVVPPEDPQAIAEATLRLLRDDDLRARMGRAGRERTVERFSVERCVDVHLQAYACALQQRARQAS